jgi:hypothetical protein
MRILSVSFKGIPKVNLTVCYITCRRNCHFPWFADSLALQGFTGLVIFVDQWKGEGDTNSETDTTFNSYPFQILHVEPKPYIWSGKYRVTSRNYFSAASFRNTGLCYAPDGWIAFVDDLAVLMPGWLSTVQEYMTKEGNHVVCGAYKKVYELNVVDGVAKSWREEPSGIDSRWGQGNDSGGVQIGGAALFGCSFAAPVEAMLAINGLDEDCDPVGGEDWTCGYMLQYQGYHVWYDRRMLTLESEEDHHKEEPFLRVDRGKSPNDASHAILNMVLNGRKRAPNYFGEEGIRGLRQKILTGEPFPVIRCPEHYFFDGTKISEW